MRLTAVSGNAQRLDGGALFGNAPKALWSRWHAPDAENRIALACRALLVEEPPARGGRRVLLEAGIGAFFPPDLRARYGVLEEGHVLAARLGALGVAPDALDVIVLSHLHFDHAGGVLAAHEPGAPSRLLFPRARYVVSAAAFERARRPHLRDRRSFVPELPALLEATGRLELVAGERSETLGPAYRLHWSEGHTPGLMLVEVESARGPVVYASDLVPGRAWVNLAITTGYDRFPERLVEEKQRLLADLALRGGWLCFTHDPEVALAQVVRAGDERYEVGATLREDEVQGW